ncbi:MAG TPA: hypothetical protein VNX68_02360, partial [Nitrosopumilaceae archaeon]|nr:hypothetical protein [Nitrosopumilaceae archaeon]
NLGYKKIIKTTLTFGIKEIIQRGKSRCFTFSPLVKRFKIIIINLVPIPKQYLDDPSKIEPKLLSCQGYHSLAVSSH